IITGNGWDVYSRPKKFPAPKAPSFIAVNKKDGAVLWKSDLPGENIMEGQWSNPVYAAPGGKPQIIFPAGDGWLYALDPKTGDLVWKFFCNPKSSVFDRDDKRKTTRSYFVATPVVYDDKVYIGVGNNPEDGPGIGHFFCVDVTKKGNVSAAGDNFDPKAKENKDSALVWHFGGEVMPKPDPTTGQREIVFGRTLSTACVHDGVVYLAEFDGFIHCLDAKTGEKYWTQDLKSETWSSPYYVDGKVLMGTIDGELWVFEHGKKKKELAKVELGPPIRTTPVVHAGVLYIQTDTNLYALAPKK